MSELRWHEADRASPGDDPLTALQVRSWRERGFTLVDGVLPAELIECARKEAAEAFPDAGSAAAEEVSDFGSQGRMAFPAPGDALNATTLHPRLLAAASQLLAVPVVALRLTQSDAWPKYGRRRRGGGATDNADQRIHMDYGNHTLVHPPAWEAPEAVEIIVYLSDVAACGGATAVVAREGAKDPAYGWPLVAMPGIAGLAWRNDREAAEAHLREVAPDVARLREGLYAREVRARFRPGSVLFYRHDTWHRGTPVEPGCVRFAQNLTFRRADAEWIQILQPAWSWAMYGAGQPMERLLAGASVEQRCVLGFPAPGSAYWTRDTVAAVGARYGPFGMDMEPYEQALARSSR